MRRIGLIFIVLLLSFCVALPSVFAGKPLHTGDVIVARIVEMSQDRMMIQAGDYSFQLGPLFFGDENGETVASRFDLQEDQWLEVEVGYAGGDLLDARKMVILRGSRLNEAMQEHSQQ